MSRIRLSEGNIVDEKWTQSSTQRIRRWFWALEWRARSVSAEDLLIQECCNELGPIKVGSAAITGAGELCAQWILHAAVMEIGGAASEESVRSSLSGSLDLAREKRCRVVACPALGTGVGGSECSAVPKSLWKKPVGISLRTRLWTKSASYSSGSLHFAFSRWFRTQPPWRRR